jgi:cytidylate kinase
MTVVTLSRQSGSHGEQVASRVADALNLRLVDASMIHQAAQRAGVPQVALAELAAEGERGLAAQVLKALSAMPNLSPVGEPGTMPSDVSSLTLPFAGLFSPTVPPLSASLEGYVLMVNLVIRGLAQEGNVLIMGRGSQVVLRKHPTALHVQIVAPFADRVEVTRRCHDLSKREAQHRVRASDRARFDYVRRYHGADWLDPTLYHLIINTGRVSVDTAVDLIIAAQKAIGHLATQKAKDE